MATIATEVNVTHVKPGDTIVYGGHDAKVTHQWTWSSDWSAPRDNVGLKLSGYIGYIVLGRHDTVLVKKSLPTPTTEGTPTP